MKLLKFVPPIERKKGRKSSHFPPIFHIFDLFIFFSVNEVFLEFNVRRQKEEEPVEMSGSISVRGKHMRAVSVKAKTKYSHNFNMHARCRCAYLTDIVTQ